MKKCFFITTSIRILLILTEVMLKYLGVGHEKENDLAEGVYTTEYRLLDTRLGRWLSVDPLAEKASVMKLSELIKTIEDYGTVQGGIFKNDSGYYDPKSN